MQVLKKTNTKKWYVGKLADSGFFFTFSIKVAWSLQFLGYLTTLSLKFQRATSKNVVFLSALLAISVAEGRDRKNSISVLAYWDLKIWWDP